MSEVFEEKKWDKTIQAPELIRFHAGVSQSISGPEKYSEERKWKKQMWEKVWTQYSVLSIFRVRLHVENSNFIQTTIQSKLLRAMKPRVPPQEEVIRTLLQFVFQ